jgi:glycosyltransferase involved in cell wall biosynthesis
VGEIPSVLQDGVNACFVEPGDVAGIAAALQQVLQDDGLRASLEQSGRALYERNFSIARFFSSVAQIHQRDFGVAGRALRAPAASQGKPA